MQSPAVEIDTGDQIRKILSEYKPGSTRKVVGHNFKRVCLQLFGLIGHGKSSLINSCLCVVENCNFSNEAGSGGAGKPFTMARQEYKLTDTVYIIDNRGLNDMSKDENLEVSAQLRNLRALGNVEWEFQLEKTVNLLEDRYKNQSMDFIVPVFVYSVEKTFNFNNEIGNFARDAFEITGMLPIVVLTKHKNQLNITNTQRLLEDLGVQHIITLDNYTKIDARNPETDIKVLRFLHSCLQEADRVIQKKQQLDWQLQFVKQSINQIKSEMERHKELEKEELLRKDKEKISELTKKDKALNDKERDLQSKANQISNMQSEIIKLQREQPVKMNSPFKMN